VIGTTSAQDSRGDAEIVIKAASSEAQALQGRSVNRAVTIAGDVVSHVVVASRLLAVTGRRAP
jgi:hypothetical protein